MDPTRRMITKIARLADQLVIRTMRGSDCGAAEFDLLQTVRKHPGITQKKVCDELSMDKGAAARRTARLESKGYLRREPDPKDARAQLLYATVKADELKHSRAHTEAEFYQWLLSDLSEEELAAFASTLKKLLSRAEEEAEAGYPHVIPEL